MSHDSLVRIELAGQFLDLEYEWISPNNSGPLLVFLHEGLGSVALWRGFPAAVCEAAGCRGLVYSRPGYGWSSPIWSGNHWPVDFMHVEGREILPRFLAALGVDTPMEQPVLVGHSDGASIALIHAAAYPNRASGVVAMAPHVFVEPLTTRSIANTKDRFLTSDVPARLGKYHRDVQGVFWGWANVWLRPEFYAWDIRPLLGNISRPLLLIQGMDDEYGTMEQIEAIAAHVAQSSATILKDCGHSPHVDQPALVIEAITRFLACGTTRDR